MNLNIPKPLVQNRNVAIGAGLVLFLGGAVLLHDAFEGRGISTPFIFRGLTFW